MPRPAPRRTPPPRRTILWNRAIPIFIGMMALLYFADFALQNYAHQSPSIWSSLVAGLVGAFLISRYATAPAPTPPSKSQQRKAAAAQQRSRAPKPQAADEKEAVAAGETAAAASSTTIAGVSPAQPSRSRRRKR
ncbi:MAG: hypothetical protein KGJ86_01780 [Chloroflexota bacterium]|nr:hypothetical protein [Chloroflexota bacterium]